jgi:glycine cleavage system aminomethyltransferase T
MSHLFLSLAAGVASARSPMAECESAAGTRIEREDGWEVVVSHADADGEARACRETVGWADLSHLPKAELTGARDWLQPFRRGIATRRGEGWSCPITPRRGLLLGRTGTPAGGRLLDLTCALAAVALVGPAAAQTLSRFCAIDTRLAHLPVGGFRAGALARTPGYLLREEQSRFLILFGAAFGVHVWDALHDAGSGLGGRPVGVDAIAERSATNLHAGA